MKPAAFTSPRLGVSVGAPLDEPLFSDHDFMREIVAIMILAMRNTPEYSTYVNHDPIPSAALFDETNPFWGSTACYALFNLLTRLLQSYAPDGYVFIHLPGHAGHWGYYGFLPEKE